jgi:hypothetical protein
VPGVDAVVSHHLDGFRSGVARFDELLAARLAVPLVGLGELAHARLERPLMSFKVSELDAGSAASVGKWLDGAPAWDVFLHEHAGLELERRLVEGATRVLCGNLEIEQAVRALNDSVEALWTPGLILDERPFPQPDLSVFTFGMAHKIRTDMFRRLRELLDASGRSYAVYVSAANHETSSLRDAEQVFAEMHEIFPETMFFLGNLSDVAIHHWLTTTTYFASFFARGVRDNNTSVASAMERGAVVITNLDACSSPSLVHGRNVVDLRRSDRLPVDPAELRAIGEAAVATAQLRSWDALVERLRP